MGNEVDRNRLEQLIKQLIQRHESFRTSFIKIDDVPVQRVHDEVSFELEGPEQLSGTEALDQFIRPFDLGKAPLFRSLLARMPEGNLIWAMDMHHIVSDGVSQTVFWDDFSAMMRDETLEPLPLQYKDFSLWQNRLLNSSDEIEAQKKYWLDVFSPNEELPRLNLPADRPRPPVFNYSGDTFSFRLDERESMQLEAFGNRLGATLYMNLLAALNTLLYRYTGQTDIILGSVIFGRPHADLRGIVGMFVNTLAMRAFPDGDKTYEDFLEEVKDVSVSAFENQDLPFEELVEYLELERDTSRHSLFDVSMSVQNVQGAVGAGETNKRGQAGNEMNERGQTGNGEEHPARQIDYRPGVSRFDMTFYVYETESGIRFDLEYYTSVYDKATIQRLAIHLKQLLNEIVRDPSKRLKDFDILSEEEKRRILYEFNDNTVEFQLEKGFSRLFDQRVEASRDRVALERESLFVTFGELKKRSDAVAVSLTEQGVRQEEIVAIEGGRTLEVLIGMIAVLKAGAAFLTVDPEFPEERINFMLEDSQVRFILCESESPWRKGMNRERESDELYRFIDVREAFREYRTGMLPPQDSNHLSQLSYIIYTSGSTGKPKAVMIQRGGFLNCIYDAVRAFDISHSDRWVSVMSFTFDASLYDIFGSLMGGAVLVMVTEEKRADIEGFPMFLEKHDVTVAVLPPSYLRQAPRDRFPRLSTLMTCGEAPNADDVFHYSTTNNYYNGYGPTEISICASYYKFPSGHRGTVSIGKPIVNTAFHVLDRDLNPVPVGVAGELYISGAGVGRGYMNNPEMTASQFIGLKPQITQILKEGYETAGNPIQTYNVYRTGDLVRWMEDGNVEFMGRVDRQVKVRGFRVEPGEIENRLLQHEAVTEAVAQVYRGRDLCAWFVASKPVEVSALRDFLAETMPEYMIPSFLILLEEMPLNRSGKVNRGILPGPSVQKQSGYVAPSDELEKSSG